MIIGGEKRRNQLFDLDSLGRTLGMKVRNNLGDSLKEGRDISRDGIAYKTYHSAANVVCSEEDFTQLLTVVHLNQRLPRFSPALPDLPLYAVEIVEEMAVTNRGADVARSN